MTQPRLGPLTESKLVFGGVCSLRNCFNEMANVANNSLQCLPILMAILISDFWKLKYHI